MFQCASKPSQVRPPIPLHIPLAINITSIKVITNLNSAKAMPMTAIHSTTEAQDARPATLARTSRTLRPLQETLSLLRMLMLLAPPTRTTGETRAVNKANLSNISHKLRTALSLLRHNIPLNSLPLQIQLHNLRLLQVHPALHRQHKDAMVRKQGRHDRARIAEALAVLMALPLATLNSNNLALAETNPTLPELAVRTALKMQTSLNKVLRLRTLRLLRLVKLAPPPWLRQRRH